MLRDGRPYRRHFPRQVNAIYYRSGAAAADVARVTRDFQAAFSGKADYSPFVPTSVTVVSYFGVGSFHAHTDLLNTFQVRLEYWSADSSGAAWDTPLASDCVQATLATDGNRSTVTLCFDQLLWAGTDSTAFRPYVNSGFVRRVFRGRKGIWQLSAISLSPPCRTRATA